MTNFSTLLQQGNAWLFIPSAILLGALHGLEPGHSKTMMAAFIVAVRGTIGQAILLGLSATLSHTAVVWAVAMTGLYFGRNWSMETAEPYFQLASAALIIAVATWMIWRTRRNLLAERVHNHEHHGNQPDESRIIDTGHGKIRLEIFEQGAPPRFRLYREDSHGHAWPVAQVKMETERPDGNRQRFSFIQRDGFIESEQDIPEPHQFMARLSLGHDRHSHDYDVEFIERHHHATADVAGLDASAAGYQDPHELAHANDIRRRFANREVSTGQIVMFGLTGGLIPCPASITVLLLCLQLKKVALGAALALCFSIGLALTMVASGVLAAVSVKHVSSHWSGFGDLTRKAPYFSSGLIVLVGLYVGYHGWAALP
ncbi:nickel/cobalt efflux protein RcnA [Chromobacterium sphagni]|uniref:Nickel/cobalt efflux system n=1 Tax=Chromobacterium sphagni TaxID=1903179 RepID=A0A1S1WWL4_9NEIS|nr:nickel/cobalt efflux protein RcnA [Chromobacterium sphagni]OHX11690.1 nickel/cobalt efflux protein RcnA [Chromobacterium sphagni]OHX15533.1 nickel/cobalt efflux protein RcnA [Chromobacterium sphagni]